MEPNHLEPAAVSEPQPGRRRFMQWISLAFGVVASLMLAVPFVGYVLGLKRRTIQWVDLGPVSGFPRDATRYVTFDNPTRKPWDGIVARTGVYVRYEGKDEAQRDRFLVLAANCAHLGCPVSWFPQSGLFMCPCHGGVYYATGERASGPPPRGLFRCAWRVRGGALEVQAPHYPTLQDPLIEPS